MRKLTYKQAATCGEKLKARVTHEQSEKMQKAWFSAGKRWCGGGDKVAHVTVKFLWLGNDLIMGNSEEYFILHKNEEIELIDGLHPAYFASQLEVIAWFVVGEKAIHTENRVIVGFKDGVLWDFSLDRKCILNFFDFERWERYTQPRLIRINGIEVPAPLKSLDGLEWVYAVDFDCKNWWAMMPTKPPTNTGKRLLKLGLLYENEQDAIKRAEAMLKYCVVK